LIPKPERSGKIDTSNLPFGVKPRKPRSGLKNKRKPGKVDTSSFVFPIQTRIEDPETVKTCRKPYCEYCGKAVGNYDPHHIINGPGRPDHPWNLIMLCGQRAIDGCHKKAQLHEIPDSELWEIQCRKFGTPAKIVREAMKAIEGGPHKKDKIHDTLVELAGIAMNDPCLKDPKGRAIAEALRRII
jgi:hypothetical protein